MTGEPDPMLRRFERNLAVSCLAMAAIAAIAGRLDVTLGILGGGILMAFSYRAIKGGVDAIVGPASAPASAGEPASGPASAGKPGSAPASAGKRAGRKRKLALLVRFVGRYALLALAAYVMLTRLHTHPVGLLIGAASPAVAAAAEAVRVLRAGRPGQSR